MGANAIGDDFKGGAITGEGCGARTKVGTLCDYEGVEPDGKWSGAKLRCGYNFNVFGKDELETRNKWVLDGYQYKKVMRDTIIRAKINGPAGWVLEGTWQWYL
jgi:hypothetical protein